MTSSSYIKSKYSFIKLGMHSFTNTEHLLSARHCSRQWGYRDEQNDRVPVTYSRGQDRSSTNKNLPM